VTSRAEQLALRRHILQMRCSLQRQEIAQLFANVESRLTGADRAADFVIRVVKNPLLLIAIAAGTVMIGPWRILRWVSQGAMLVRIARNFRRLWIR